MAKIILVTGGTRSGKSSYAQRLAEALPQPRCFIATCRVADEEMVERVRKHQEQRLGKHWTTIEEPVALKEVLSQPPYFPVYLIDCLTLWISNVMEEYDVRGKVCDEDTIRRKIEEVLACVKDQRGTYLFVSGEVGMGIVPQNQIARRYRDLVGHCNNCVAALAQEVVFVSCGLPLYLKKA